MIHFLLSKIPGVPELEEKVGKIYSNLLLQNSLNLNNTDQAYYEELQIYDTLAQIYSNPLLDRLKDEMRSIIDEVVITTQGCIAETTFSMDSLSLPKQLQTRIPLNYYFVGPAAKINLITGHMRIHANKEGYTLAVREKDGSFKDLRQYKY